MLLKIIAFISAAIPIFLFVRAMFFKRPTKTSERFKEFKKQTDRAIFIFLGLVGCIVAFAIGKLVWAWWTAADVVK
jgi:phosphate/sulfate permease